MRQPVSTRSAPAVALPDMVGIGDLSPWLLLMWEARREMSAPEWGAAISPAGPSRDAFAAMTLRPPEDRGCLLADAPVAMAPAPVVRLAHRLLGAGGAGLRTRLGPGLALGLLAAAVEQDDAAIAGLARDLDVPSQRLSAIAPFLAMPLLVACNHAWSAAVPRDWSRGHCPVCAAWPALAEIRGPERVRRLRCSRCGGEWGSTGAGCPFCAGADRDHLALLPVGAGARDVEACQQCGGYLKRVTTAVPIPPGDVAMRDLLTIDLDLAAREAGLTRPTVRALQAGESAGRSERSAGNGAIRRRQPVSQSTAT